MDHAIHGIRCKRNFKRNLHENIRPCGGKFLFDCNYSENDFDVFAGTNKFLKDVLTSWASYTCNSKNDYITCIIP